MISKNFFETLEAVAFDRGLDIADVLKKVEIAMAVASRDNGYSGDIKIDFDSDKNKIRVFEYLYVVEEIDPDGGKGQITLEEALERKDKVKVGSVIKNEVNISSFGRKSASKFKQTFISGLKELEREEAYIYFADKVGEIVNGIVVSNTNGFISFDIGKNNLAHMPETEGIPGEEYIPGDTKKVYISKVEKTTKGPKVFITRKNKEIVKRLFELNVPEIANGTVEIMGISRDPGSRSKVGVLSLDPNVDAKGACVGNAGLRVKSINMVLNDEKIDIFTWKDTPEELIAEALLPAQVASVIIDLKTRSAVVIVRDEQYSLAIGKSGQNARLAAYAIGWKIDIKKISDAKAEGINFTFNIGK